MNLTHICLGLFSLMVAFVGRCEKLDNSQIAQAIESKDINQVLRILPAIDELWTANSKDYFKSVKSAVSVLNTATNINDRAFIAILFSNTLVKPFPSETKKALDCLEDKNDLVLFILNYGEVRDSREEWINIAKYVGVIRGQINLKYVRKEVARNYVNPGEGLSVEQIEQRRIENEKNETDNRFQDSLRNSNTILTFQLINNARRFATNADFIKSIVAQAHLTDEEQHEIRN